MTKRCSGDRGARQAYFLCVLDEGHEGGCEPYVPPTANEWRAVQAELKAMRGFFGLARESADPCPGCGL